MRTLVTGSSGHLGEALRRVLPDSVGLDILPSKRATALRADGMPVIGWTVRSPAEREKSAPHCDNIIFEGFAA